MPAGGGRALACGDWLIRRACRRLPAGAREQELEWLGELPVILADPDVCFAWVRLVRMLMFACGATKLARRMPKTADARRRRAESETASHSRAGAACSAKAPMRSDTMLQLITLIAAITLELAATAADRRTGSVSNPSVYVLLGAVIVGVTIVGLAQVRGVLRRRRERAR